MHSGRQFKAGLLAAAVALAGLGFTAGTFAATVMPTDCAGSGTSCVSGAPTTAGYLDLTVSNTAPGAAGVNGGGNGRIDTLSSVSYHYGDTFNTQQTSNYGSTAYGFYDDFIFTVAPNQVDAVTTTLSLGSSLGITGLQARVYNFTAATVNGTTYVGNGIAPLTTSPTGYVVQGWSSSTAFLFGSLTTDVIGANRAITLGAGTYVLEVRGTASGASGGSYSGNLNLTPVPLPASSLLMAAGLGLVGATTWRRRR